MHFKIDHITDNFYLTHTLLHFRLGNYSMDFYIATSKQKIFDVRI